MQIQFTLLSAGMQPGCIQSCIAASLALAVTCLKPGSAAPLCGEGGEADEELARGISPFTGTQWFILCWDGEKDPPVPPHPQVLSLLRCGAGSPSLPQAALEISPGMRCDAFHLTFFFFFSTYRLGKQQQVTSGGRWTWDQQSSLKDFAFHL